MFIEKASPAEVLATGKSTTVLNREAKTTQVSGKKEVAGQLFRKKTETGEKEKGSSTYSTNNLVKSKTKVMDMALKAKKNDEPKEEEAYSWPPFSFDGSTALKHKLVLNLRACQYDLFRSIALDELGWKVVDYSNKTWEVNEQYDQ